MQESKIKAFIFDVDGTLMDTVQVFIDAYQEEEEILKKVLGSEEAGEKISLEFQRDMYAEGGKYKGFLNMYYISESFSKDLVERGLIKEEQREIVEEKLKDVYNMMPVLYPDALELLKYIKEKGYMVSFSTHSGDWGKDKIEYIWKKLGFNMDELKYLSIPLEEEKDVDSWKKIINILNVKPEEIVVVGDNPEEDIENSIKAGIKKCVFLARALHGDYKFRNEEFEMPKGYDAEVWKVKDLREIKELF